MMFFLTSESAESQINHPILAQTCTKNNIIPYCVHMIPDISQLLTKELQCCLGSSLQPQPPKPQTHPTTSNHIQPSHHPTTGAMDDPRSSMATPPLEFGNYELKNELGHGASGRVCLGG